MPLVHRSCPRSCAVLLAAALLASGSQARADDVLLGKFASLPTRLGQGSEANELELFIVSNGDRYLVTEFRKGVFRYDFLARPCDPRPEMRSLLPPGEVRGLCTLGSGSVSFVYSRDGLDASGLAYAQMKDQDGQGPFGEGYFQQQYYVGFLALRKVESFTFAPNDTATLLNHETAEFAALCRSAGVTFLEKPAAPVRSIAYDFDPERLGRTGWYGASRIELDEDGRTLVYGGFARRGSAEAAKAAAFDFTERRAGDRAGAATMNPRAPYYRFPGRGSTQPYYGVEQLGADVVALLDVDKPDEYRKAPIGQGAIRYQITLTDRRSGAVLGVQVFVVDRLNHRACGANVENAISPPAFVFDAINR